VGGRGIVTLQCFVAVLGVSNRLVFGLRSG